MENSKFQFKTSINCGGCISKIKSDLDNAKGIADWRVDTGTSDKILTIIANGITREELMDIVKRKGFIIETVIEGDH